MLGLALVLVATTLLMAVNERTYEIGVLAALGWSDFGILSLIVLEGVLITALGALLGVVLGLGVMEVAADTDMAAGYLRPYTTGLLFSGPYCSRLRSGRLAPCTLPGGRPGWIRPRLYGANSRHC